MTSITFVIDESGAKGYSDNHEQHEGELGVVAGILIPEKHVATVETALDTIATKEPTINNFTFLLAKSCNSS